MLWLFLSSATLQSTSSPLQQKKTLLMCGSIVALIPALIYWRLRWPNGGSTLLSSTASQKDQSQGLLVAPISTISGFFSMAGGGGARSGPPTHSADPKLKSEPKINFFLRSSPGPKYFFFIQQPFQFFFDGGGGGLGPAHPPTRRIQN